jgi:methyl-accepting chemotaxis protein
MAEQPAGGELRRKKLFINRELQGRLIGVISLFVVAAGILMVIWEFFGGPKEGLQLLVRLLLVLILVLIGVVYVGIRFSHRIAGPIYAFGRQLMDIYRGDYTRDLKFRRGDEFQNVAGIFNQTMGVLRERAQEDIAFAEKIHGLIGASSMDAPSKEALAMAIKEYRAKKERHIKGS